MAGKRFVPLEKQSTKAQKEHFAERRGSWEGVVPVTRVIPNKKKKLLEKEKARRDTDL